MVEQHSQRVIPHRGQILIHLGDQVPILVLDYSGRNPTNVVQLIPNCCPTVMDTVWFEFATNQVGRMISQYRDDQMRFNTDVLVLKRGAETALETRNSSGREESPFGRV